MVPDTLAFLQALFAPCEQGFITLTALHPDGLHATPSRHVPVGEAALLARTLERLAQANRQGWGACMGVATRTHDLGRWRRGGGNDLLALPALFVDVDDPAPETVRRLRQVTPPPSCIVATGGGYHAYWWLAAPLTDFDYARGVLRALAAAVGGDPLSPAQSLRLPGSHNTKPGREGARCRVVAWQDRRYALAAFERFGAEAKRVQPSGSFSSLVAPASWGLNPALLAAVAGQLLDRDYRRSGEWLRGSCPFPHHHRHNDCHPSFGFNLRSGWGYCFVCGTVRLKDLCVALGIRPAAYGGLRG